MLVERRERTRRSDVHSARLPPLHKILVHGVSSPRHELERLGERDLPAASLVHVNHADTGALTCAAGFRPSRLEEEIVGGRGRLPPCKIGFAFPQVRDRVRPPITDVFCDGGRT